jgi:hypothetical protein
MSQGGKWTQNDKIGVASYFRKIAGLIPFVASFMVNIERGYL